MKRLVIIFLVAVSVFFLRGLAGAAGDNDLIFVRAYPASEGIKFDPPVEINWRSLAPKRYEKLSPSEQLELAKQKDMFRNTEKEYTVRINSKLAGRHYYLISPEGICELRVETMKGTVRFSFNNDSQSLTGRTDYGSLIGVAKVGKLPQSGGFVAVTFELQDFERNEVEIDLAKLKISMLKDAVLAQETKIMSPEYWTIIKKFSFHNKKSGHAYNFIQFAPDINCKSGCCQSRFILSTSGSSLEITLWNLFGCDV